MATSLVLIAALIYLRWTIGILAYFIVLTGGFFVGLPGGMRYQADVDAHLAKHPTLSRADLPWPAEYTGLDRKRARKYVLRGLMSAVVYGLLMPVLLVMGALASLRLLSVESLQGLYSDDEAA